TERGARLEGEWNRRFEAWRATHESRARQWDAVWQSKPQPMPGLDEALPNIDWGKDKLATRAAGQKVMAAFEDLTPTMIGGPADRALRGAAGHPRPDLPAPRRRVGDRLLLAGDPRALHGAGGARPLAPGPARARVRAHARQGGRAPRRLRPRGGRRRRAAAGPRRHRLGAVAVRPRARRPAGRRDPDARGLHAWLGALR